MKIGYIAPTGVFGGVRVVTEHLNRLADRGHECVYLWTDAPMAWLPLRCEQRPAADPGAGFEIVVGSAIATWPAARTLADSCNGAAWGLMQMAEWLFAVKGSDAERAVLEQFTTPMDGIMTISEWLRYCARAVHDPTKVWPIRNGVDPTLFYHDPIADIRKTGEFVIVTEGGETGRAKDIGGMVRRALNRFRLDHGARFRLIGFAQHRPTLEYDAFWTQPSQADIRRIYSSGDVFVKASRFEGRPGPDIEAMACGVPVCRAIGMGGDDLRDGQNALACDYWDDNRFLYNLRRLYEDKDLRAQLAAGGLKYVLEHYDWPRAIDTIEETLTGTVTTTVGVANQPAYDLSSYNNLQGEILGWETPQAEWLGEVLLRELAPRTVVDVGCGPGTYLIPFAHTAKILGVDGAPMAGRLLSSGQYVSTDLRNDESFAAISGAASGAGFADERGNVWPADLALCIETGEHLPVDRADYLVDLLTAIGRVILFSAAQPGQGGTGHINEQPREWWLAKFRERGFELHPRHEWLTAEIANNEQCQRVRWLIGNAMLLKDTRGTGGE